MYSPDFALWKWDVLLGSTITAPGDILSFVRSEFATPRPM
jgi:hypothetical protein